MFYQNMILINQFIMKYLLIFLSIPLLTNCGSFVPVIKTGNLEDKVVVEASKVKIYRLGREHPEIKTNLGQIKSNSCKNMTWDPEPSEEDANLQLQIRAIDKGANGIVNVRYSREGTSLLTNCWSLIRASGTAVIFENKVKEVEPKTNIINTSKIECAVSPVSVIGDISDVQKEFFNNHILEIISNEFKVIPQTKFEEAMEKAFTELEYDECNEDQCYALIQDILQVENIFTLQILKDKNLFQLSLKLITLDEKLIQTDLCENCSTQDLLKRINNLFINLKSKFT